MKRDLVILGYGRDEAGDRWDVAEIACPTEKDVIFVLERCRTGDAVAMFEGPEGQKNEYPKLDLQAEHGRYLLLLAELNEEEEIDVRTLTNPNPRFNPDAPKGMDHIGGEPFPASAIVTDFDLVLRAFQEFARTGNVSRDLMT